MIEATCQQCNKKFGTYSSLIARGKGKYCSRKCFDIGRINSIERICKACNKKFMIWPSRLNVDGGHYCSIECYHPNKSFMKKCKTCGKKFRVWQYQVDNEIGIYCSRYCQYPPKNRTGRYIKKIFRAKARALALKTFEPICVVCGLPEDHVHHKNCNPADNNLSNLEFRCIPCHIDIHREIRERAG